MAIRIIVDSSADMEEDYAAEHDITIIPMTIALSLIHISTGAEAMTRGSPPAERCRPQR